jgi:MFS family permease
VHGDGPLGAGLRLLPWTATLFFVAPVAGALADRYGPRRFIGAGLALQALGFAVVALDHHYATMVGALMVAGAGVSMALPASISAAVAAVPEHVGKAAGVNSTLRQLGGVFGIAVTVAVFSGAGGYASFEDGFERALLLASALSLAGALCAAALPAGRRTGAAPAPVTV